MTNTRRKTEYLSKDTEKLENALIERYGKKRGKSLIAAAKQTVDYQSINEHIAWVRAYEAELKKRL